MGSKRNGKVELWRFLFSVIIMLHHSRYFLGDAKCLFLGGSLAVEFFFMVSGYLMMASIARVAQKNPEVNGLGKETLSFLWKKAKSVYPAALLAWLLGLAVTAYATDKQFFTLALDSVFEVTLLKMSGLPSISINGVVWYISTMLLCMAVLYPLVRKFPGFMKYVGFLLIALFCFGYLAGNFNDPRNPPVWLGFTKKGNVRGMAEIALGGLIYVAVERFEKVNLTTAGKWAVAAAEWLLNIVAVAYMYYSKAGKTDYIVIVLMAVAVGLSFSHKGIDAKLYDNGFFGWLGKYSLYLFLGHISIAHYLKQLVPATFSGGQKMAVYLAGCVVSSAVLWGLTVIVKKCTPKVGGFLKRLLVKAEA